MSLLADWAAKHAPEKSIPNTLTRLPESFVNDYASVCYTALPMFLLIRERLRVMTQIEGEKAELEGLLKTSTAEQERLKGPVGEGQLRVLMLQGEVNELQSRLDSVESELMSSKALLERVEEDNAWLAVELGQARRDVVEELANQRAELEASVASQAAAAVEEFKSSAERSVEQDMVYYYAYNATYNTCLGDVRRLYPNIDLNALATEEVEDAPTAEAEDAHAAAEAKGAPDVQPPSSTTDPPHRNE
ncbi:uncharacterized protein LOC131247259 [Magnolia sinica]|uniref:uncharacterized protein LOC131247259 n=1 Tax=Magnolia sinica TaxID=86752 RepID=UPI002658EDAA|nr:uncharacterized protein LOC131247259 [Magnolia sinica]